MRTGSLRALAFCLISTAWIGTATAEEKAPEPLPFVQDFKPEKYLGKWYEVARLPTLVQPAGTLAVAEYAAGKEAGMVTVKNTAYDKTGKKLLDIAGEAKLVDGDPPGRLVVSFGPIKGKAPNYHVMHVDPGYRYAVVGNPDRKTLWILAREVPIGEESLKSLQEIAKKAGFDVSKLLIAPWDKVPKAAGGGADGPEADAKTE